MQYMLKLTPLGVQAHVFRVVSLEGQADVDHVLTLCDLAFDYAHYAERALYFAQDGAALQALNIDCPELDSEHYGPSDDEFAPFWQQELPLESLALEKFALGGQSWRALERFDAILGEYSARVGQELKEDTHPREQGERFKFVYVVNGVQHLVEVLMCSTKLNCFVPATIMGAGLIVDDDPQRPLSTALIDESVAAEQAAEAAADADSAADADANTTAITPALKVDESVEAAAKSKAPMPIMPETGLNLKLCTTRMRALGAMRSEQSMHQALQQAGEQAITVKIC